MAAISRTLYDRLGGRPIFERVHKIFYDEAYADPWLGKFFAHVPQKHIENQQTDFMGQCCGGPKIYCGRAPNLAHTHINITTDMVLHRRQMLAKAIARARVAKDLAIEWLDVDERFTRAVLKKSIADCKPRYRCDPILNFPKPHTR